MSEGPTRFEALLACRDKAGSDSQMARDLGVTQPRAWRWLNQSKQLPDVHVLDAERLYDISRHDLRPDLYPRESCACRRCRETMVDQASELRFKGVDQRATNRADRFSLAERQAQAG